ncbi:MAG: protein SCO1/2 [Lysobacterales bacterium]
MFGGSESLPYYLDKALVPVWAEQLEGLPHKVGTIEGVNQVGELVERPADQVRIVNFFFATCPGVCTTTMRNLLSAQEAISVSAGQMISLSITPNIDTPETLAKYAKYTGVKAETWQLLSSSEELVSSLARESFFAVLDRNIDKDAFVHTEIAYLLDRQGHISGVYNATSKADLLRLVEDYQLLAQG